MEADSCELQRLVRWVKDNKWAHSLINFDYRTMAQLRKISRKVTRILRIGVTSNWSQSITGRRADLIGHLWQD